MPRIVNENGILLTKEAEGLRLEAYRDGGGVWTIGYGHTKGVRQGQKSTLEQAEVWLEADLLEAEKAVLSLVRVPLTDNQFAALVDFTFNLGEPRLAGSTLLRKLNAGEYDRVPDYLKAWVFDNGKVVSGLVKRRAAEAALWKR